MAKPSKSQTATDRSIMGVAQSTPLSDVITDDAMLADIPKFQSLLTDLTARIRDVAQQIQPSVSKVSTGEIATSKGLSLLDVKCHTLLQYLLELAFVVDIKLCGHRLEDHPVIMKLIEQRTVLERLKPVEVKMRYRIEKLVRAAADLGSKTGGVSFYHRAFADNNIELADGDSLSFRPNPQSLVQDAPVGEDEDGEAKDGIYQPPKLFPVHFTEGNPAAENEKKFARQLARARKSRLMHDLIAEYDDRPEEILDFSTWKENEKEREREVYEEENFTRLMTSKRETSKMRRKKDLDDEFEHLNDFAPLSSLHDEDNDRVGVLQRKRMRHEQDEEGSGEEKESREGTSNKRQKKTRTTFEKQKKMMRRRKK